MCVYKFTSSVSNDTSKNIDTGNNTINNSNTNDNNDNDMCLFTSVMYVV